MGHDLQTPLLQNEQQHPSAPPLQAYPQIPQPDVSVPAVNHVIGFPTLPPHQHETAHTSSGPITPPRGYPLPPAHAVIERHTVHAVHVPGDTALARVAACPPSEVCPACQSAGPVDVRRESGVCAWLTAIATCWVCCPLFWVPFCLDCDKDLVHRCSVCGSEVARVKPWQ